MDFFFLAVLRKKRAFMQFRDNMMECKKVKHKLSAFIDHELPGEEELIVKRHLLRCQDCMRDCEEIRRVEYLLGKIAEIEPSHDFWSMLSPRLIFNENCLKGIWGRIINIVRDLTQGLQGIRSKKAINHTFSLDVFHDFPPESFGQLIFYLNKSG